MTRVGYQTLMGAEAGTMIRIGKEEIGIVIGQMTGARAGEVLMMDTRIEETTIQGDNSCHYF